MQSFKEEATLAVSVTERAKVLAQEQYYSDQRAIMEVRAAALEAERPMTQMLTQRPLNQQTF